MEKIKIALGKFKNPFATQILREINFGEFRVSKMGIQTTFGSTEFQFGQISAVKYCTNLPKLKFQDPKIGKMTLFETLKS